MREEPGAVVDAGSSRDGLKQTGEELARKFRIAMVLYAILAALSWFILDGKIRIEGRLVELKLIPLVIIGGLALRTILAVKAEKIRRQDSESAARVFEARVDRKAPGGAG